MRRFKTNLVSVFVSFVLIVGLCPGFSAAYAHADELLRSDGLVAGLSSAINGSDVRAKAIDEMNTQALEALTADEKTVVQISLGARHSAALMSDGSLWTWGINDCGQLGDGTYEDRCSPAKVLDGVAAVSLWGVSSAALKSDGSLWMWGPYFDDEIDDGTTELYQNSPAKVMDGVSQVSLGQGHSAALKTDGTLWMWGDNQEGQVGDGTTEYRRNSPVKVMDGVSQVSLGNWHSAALKSDGTLWMWGENSCGQLGDGTTVNRNYPAKVMDGVSQVSLGAFHSAALKTDGTLWMWGENYYGQLGDGTAEDQNVPVKVMDGVSSVALGENHSAAIKPDGSLWMWGNNVKAQLGAGDSRVNRVSPAKTMDDVYQVSLGDTHSSALKPDGSLWMWGNGYLSPIDEYADSYLLSPVCVFKNGQWESGGGNDLKPSKFKAVDMVFAANERKTAGHGSYATTEVEWDDAWFEKSSKVYNHELATTASVLACAAYLDGAKIQGNFEKLGFDPDSMLYFNPDADNGYSDANGGYDQVAYAFATRYTNDGVPIVAVTIRGTAGNVEWLSNLNVNDAKKANTSVHQGFSKIRNNILDVLETYIQENDIDVSQARFLITGHSRGGAVANLIGATLDDGERAQFKGLSSDRVFDYTFASAMVATGSSLSSAKYRNIFNIVNPEDVVPQVPLSYWGFGRYGSTLVLPSISNTSYSTYKRMYDLMNMRFKGYVGGASYRHFTAGCLASSCLRCAVFAGAPTVWSLYQQRHLCLMPPFVSMTMHDLFEVIVKAAFLGDSSQHSKLLQASETPVFQAVLISSALPMLVDGRMHIGDEARNMHTEETYVSWMQSADAELGVMPAIFRDSYVGVRVACPVDVYVYDAEGGLVASIEDDVVDESLLDGGLPAAVIGDEKCVDIPSDGEYRVEVVAREAGVMDFRVEELNGYDSNPESVKAYLGVPLEAGQVLTCESPESLVAEEHVLMSGGSEAAAQSVVSGSDAERVTVLVSTEGDGDAWGSADALIGQEVVVHALPTEDSQFVGWFVGGKKASAEQEYSFRPAGSIELVAKFEQKQEPDPGTDPDPEPATVPMYRLYNPYSGEHFYTGDAAERKNVIKAGWNDEQVGWYAPADDESVPVYRVYNKYGGEHHYTTDKAERDMLVRAGWNDEGIGWYSDPAETVPLLREYNPYQFACNHNYTTDRSEHDNLIKIGWKDEGFAWYAVKAGK